MFQRVLLILPFLLFTQACMSEKTCSDQDRTCSVQANILSFFTAPEGVYVYSSSARTGNLAVLGSGTLDPSLHTICSQDRPFAPIIDIGCSSVAPLVSSATVSANSLTSLYADIPTTIPVRGPSGTIISDGLTSLFGVDLKTTLANAGISNGSFWSFSDGEGSSAPSVSCNSGDDYTDAYTGAIGNSILTTALSWFASTSDYCNSLHPILCICYRPVATGG
ncbi:hypothetical protein [Leptospira sarikeiensis]|uniref:DUF1554 domain-containing protein n=1 Tax=Leptospira sarikeiensis TaxID=2484943 RepID=A0A4R9K6Z1_9LEPT|nr:hypothetical protein [Leptospira sarikeiensis]TGL61407.1 hypothetical protein EHQ64_10490 [Leptospira sarikeiensis]